LSPAAVRGACGRKDQLLPDSLEGIRIRLIGGGKGNWVGKEQDLRWTRLRYRKVDIRKDPAAKAFVRSVADGNGEYRQWWWRAGRW
jgi:hypothetical protein